MKRRAAFILLGLAAGIVLLIRLASLPSPGHKTISSAILDTENTRLRRALATDVERHPGLSGIHPLEDAGEAFAARVLLARAAERSLDLQYYIWRNDLTGIFLLKELKDAAERGVRVRLLLDDHPAAPLDDALSALLGNPNIEIRLFNPYVFRRGRILNLLASPLRLNRRMHNKSFTADSQVSIVGGRNVGDEYFGATDGVLFADLDVAAIGQVVPEVSKDFDRYWNSPAAYPAELLLAPLSPSKKKKVLAREQTLLESETAASYRQKLRQTRFVSDLLERRLSYEWAPTRLVSDDPAKIFGSAPRRAHLGPQLMSIVGEPQSELALVSPYFVPGKAGVEAFSEMVKRGVDVKILTNSLEATDVAAVQSYYSKRRVSLLKGGVQLFELGRLSASKDPTSGPWGSSGSSLHAKTFAIDRERIFVGSFNFDPRSNLLNTELGFIIESPTLATRISERFTQAIPTNSYEVKLDEKDRTIWLERKNGQTITHHTEPGTTWWQRTGVVLLSWLPIEGLL